MSAEKESFESPPVLDAISWNRLASPKQTFLSPEKSQHRRKLSDREMDAEIRHCQRTQKSEQCENEREYLMHLTKDLIENYEKGNGSKKDLTELENDFYEMAHEALRNCVELDSIPNEAFDLLKLKQDEYNFLSPKHLKAKLFRSKSMHSRSRSRGRETDYRSKSLHFATKAKRSSHRSLSRDAPLPGRSGAKKRVTIQASATEISSPTFTSVTEASWASKRELDEKMDTVLQAISSLKSEMQGMISGFDERLKNMESQSSDFLTQMKSADALENLGRTLQQKVSHIDSNINDMDSHFTQRMLSMDGHKQTITQRMLSMDGHMVDMKSCISSTFLKLENIGISLEDLRLEFNESLDTLEDNLKYCATVEDLNREIGKNKGNILSVIRDMGEKLLPTPTYVQIEEGNWTEKAVLVFECKRSNLKKGYTVSKAGLWMKHFYMLAQLGTATVQVLVGDLVDSALTVHFLIRKLCREYHDTYSEIFASPCLKSKEHDKLLQTLIANGFYEHFEYVVFEEEPQWCIRPEALKDISFRLGTTENTKSQKSECKCILS